MYGINQDLSVHKPNTNKLQLVLTKSTCIITPKPHSEETLHNKFLLKKLQNTKFNCKCLPKFRMAYFLQPASNHYQSLT